MESKITVSVYGDEQTQTEEFMIGDFLVKKHTSEKNQKGSFEIYHMEKAIGYFSNIDDALIAALAWKYTGEIYTGTYIRRLLKLPSISLSEFGRDF